MAQAEYGKRPKDLPIAQIESELQKALLEAIPADAIKNMPVEKVEEKAMEAIKGLGFFPFPPLPDVKCRIVCKFKWPPGELVCELTCDIVF